VGGTLPEGRCRTTSSRRLQKNRTYRSRMQRRPTELSNPRADLAGTFKRAFLACSTLPRIFLSVVVAQAGLGFNAPGTPRRNSANTSTAIRSTNLLNNFKSRSARSPLYSSRHPSHPISPSSSTSLAPISKSTASALLSPTLPPGCSHKNLRQNSERPSSSDSSTPSRASASHSPPAHGSSDFSVADYSYDDMWPGNPIPN